MPNNRSKRFINKDGCIKYINKSDLNSYLADGWKLGMKPECKKSRIGKMVHVYNGIESLYIPTSDLQKYIDMGYVRNKKSLSKVWINDSYENKMIYESEIGKYINLGWKLGRTE